MESRQITININDTSPKENTAYVDIGKENKVYNKAQVLELIEDVREGTLGSISPSQTLQQLNSLPDGNYYAAEAGTYAFGEVVPIGWQYRFNKTVATWKVLTKVQIPMQDLTPLENRVTTAENKVDDFIRDFAVEVDTEFIPISENAVSSKAVNEWLYGVNDQSESVELNIQSSFLDNGTNQPSGFVYLHDYEIPEGRLKKIRIKVTSSGNMVVRRYIKLEGTLIFKDKKTINVTTGDNTVNVDWLLEEPSIFSFYGWESSVGLIYNATDNSVFNDTLYGSSVVGKNDSNISISSLAKAKGAFQVGFTTLKYKLSNGQVVDSISKDNAEKIPNVGAILNYVTNPSKQVLTEIILIPSYGQSLSIGTDGGASTFSSAVDIAYTVNNVNSNLQDMNGGYVEMFKDMANQFNVKLPTGFKIMTCLGGAGGISITNLSKGSTYYNTLINNVKTAKATANSLGKSFSVPAFCWTQGEEDYRAGGDGSAYGSGIYVPTEYATKLSKLVNDLNEDIIAITNQSIPVICVMYQVASHNTYTRYPRIAMEQLKAAINDNRIILAKTMYDVDYNTADYVHAPNRTYRNMGNHYGIALFDAIVNSNHRLPIYPVKNTRVGDSIYVQFHVPVKPLVFDDTFVSPLADNNKGFNLVSVTNEYSTTATIEQAAVTITNVSLISSDTIKIDFSASPVAGTRLTYGVNGNGWNVINGSRTGTRQSGRITGARGNLRDSQTYFNPVANYFNLYNYCPIFEIIF